MTNEIEDLREKVDSLLVENERKTQSIKDLLWRFEGFRPEWAGDDFKIVDEARTLLGDS